MIFPLADSLSLPCRLAQVVPGALHADGRRYLPTLVFALADGFEFGVVDRHHRVGVGSTGREGTARLVFLLSKLRLQTPPYTQGLRAEVGGTHRLVMRPLAFGQVVAVPTWELARDVLPYETLYTELLLDLGVGVVGVRTNATAPSIANAIGTTQLAAGDWISVERSRIDILNFA